jgi:hypothetical protein
MKFKITYKCKEYVSHGDHCEDAMEKFAGRKVFGRDLIEKYRLTQYDADTRGKKWGEFIAGWPDSEHCVMVEAAE